jgi:Arc/MetJ family transcription regulator
MHIRTNIVIHNSLMQEALKATGLKMRKKAVELGLKTLVTLKKQAAIKELKGKLHWEGNLDDLRSGQ